MKRWAVFDLDGTLMDSREAILGSFREAFRMHGVGPAPDAQVAARIGLPLTRMFAELLPSHPELHPALIEAYSAVYPDQERALGRIFPGALELLAALEEEGWGIAIATSKSGRGLDRVLAETALGPFVRVRGSNDTAERPKPDPSMLTWVLAQARTTAEHAVMVGDTAFDMEMGRRAGVRSIGVTWGSHERARLLEHTAEVVDDFDTLAVRLRA